MVNLIKSLTKDQIDILSIEELMALESSNMKLNNGVDPFTQEADESGIGDYFKERIKAKKNESSKNYVKNYIAKKQEEAKHDEEYAQELTQSMM